MTYDKNRQEKFNFNGVRVRKAAPKRRPKDKKNVDLRILSQGHRDGQDGNLQG